MPSFRPCLKSSPKGTVIAAEGSDACAPAPATFDPLLAVPRVLQVLYAWEIVLPRHACYFAVELVCRNQARFVAWTQMHVDSPNRAEARAGRPPTGQSAEAPAWGHGGGRTRHLTKRLKFQKPTVPLFRQCLKFSPKGETYSVFECSLEKTVFRLSLCVQANKSISTAQYR